MNVTMWNKDGSYRFMGEQEYSQIASNFPLTS